MNRATKEFSVFTSPTYTGPWDEVLRGSFEDARKTEIEITVFFPLPDNMAVQYVMVQVDSYFGELGGGLQYFKENMGDQEGATYSGNTQVNQN